MKAFWVIFVVLCVSRFLCAMSHEKLMEQERATCVRFGNFECLKSFDEICKTTSLFAGLVYDKKPTLNNGCFFKNFCRF